MIEELIKLANFESTFYSGELFQFDVIFLQSNINTFRIHPISFSQYFPARNLNITKFPEFQVYDFYHDKNQSQIFEYKIGQVDLEQVSYAIRTILYTEINHSNHQIGIYYNKLLQFFGQNEITQTLHRIKSKSDQIQFQYFMLPLNPGGQHEIEMINGREQEIAHKQNLRDQANQNTNWKNEIMKNPSSLEIKNKPPKQLKLKRTKKNSFFNMDDLRCFHDNFKRFQQQNLSIKRMLNEMQKLNHKFDKISVTTFYRHFLKEQKLVYRKPKTVYPNKRDEIKSRCRKIFASFILEIFQSNQLIYFYDETTFSSTMNFNKSWFLKEEPKEKIAKAPCSFFKLNLVMSFTKIISFSLTFDLFDSQNVAEFLSASANYIRNDKDHKGPILILLDNGPKNRSKLIQEMARNNHFKLLYTTPTTPQQNYAECLFQVIKQKILKMEEDKGKVQQKSSKAYLQEKILHVLFQLTKEDFVRAKNSYSHELKLTLE